MNSPKRSLSPTAKKFVIAGISILLILWISAIIHYFSPEQKKSRHAEKAKLYMEKELFAAAVKEFSQALEFAPQDEAIRLKLAKAYHRSKNPQQAIEELYKFTKSTQKNREAHILLVVVLKEQKRGEEALLVCNAFLHSHPQDTDFLNERGLLLWALGQQEKAIVDFRRALAVRPDLKVSLMNLARLYWERKNFDQTIRLLQQYLKEYPANADVHNQLALSFLELGGLEQAVNEFYKITQNFPETSKVIVPYLSLALFLQGKTKEAFTMARSSAGDDEKEISRFPILTYERGLRLVQEQKLAEALQDFQRAKQAPFVIPDVHLQLASLYLKSKNQSKNRPLAIQELQLLLQRQPDNRNTIVSLIQLLSEENRWDEANSLCLKAEKLFPKDSSLPSLREQILNGYMQSALSFYLANDGGNTISSLQKYLQYRQSTGAYNFLSLVLQRSNRLEEALQVTAKLKDDWAVQVIRGLIYQQAKKEEEAKKELSPDVPFVNALETIWEQTDLNLNALTEAIVFLQINNGSLALNRCQSILNKLPGNQFLLYLKATTLRFLQNDAGAIEILQSLVERNNSLPAVTELSELLLKEKRWEEAEETLIDALKKEPKSARLLWLISQCYELQEKKASAIGYYNRFTKATKETNDLIQAYSKLSQLSLELKETKKPLEYLEKAQKLSPKNPSILLQLAQVYIRMKKWEEAQLRLEEVLELAPSLSGVKDLMDKISLVSQKPEKDKILSYTQALRQLGHEKSAESLLEKSLSKNKDTDLAIELAQIYWNSKRKKEAFSTLNKYPKEYKAGLQKGIFYLQNYKYKEAEKVLKSISQKFTSFRKEISPYLVLTWMQLSKPDLAFELANNIIKESQESKQIHPLIYYGKGMESLGQKNYPQAVAELEYAIQSSVLPEDFFNQLAFAYLGVNDKTRALAALSRLPQERKDLLAAYILQGQIWIDLGHLAKAEHHAQKVLAFAPDDTSVLLLLAQVFTARQKFALALDILVPLHKEQGENTRAITLIIDNYIAQKDWEKAVSYAQKIPSSLDKNLILAQLYTLQEKHKKAQENLLLASQDSPRNVNILKSLADCYQRQGKFEQEQKTLQKLLELQPNSLILISSLAQCYERQKNMAEALNSYQKVIELTQNQPNNLTRAQSANNMAWLLLQTQQYNPQLALQYVREAYRLLGNQVAVLDTLGWAYYHVGEYAQAEKVFLTILQQDSRRPNTWYHLGATYARQKKNDKAQETINKALSLSNSFPEAKEAKALLKTLQEK